MWQKENGKYHMLVNYDQSEGDDGRCLGTFCGRTLRVNEKTVEAFVMDRRCKICEGVWRLVCTSVDDAKCTLRSENDHDILYWAEIHAKQATLKKAIRARIKKLEKEAGNA
jgi:hypothetical protein